MRGPIIKRWAAFCYSFFFFAGKSVDDMIKLVGKFPESLTRERLLSSASLLTLLDTHSGNYMRQAFEGVAYCHSRNVLHRDIKGRNILLDGSGNAKIADFGSAKTVDSTPAHCIDFDSIPIVALMDHC